MPQDINQFNVSTMNPSLHHAQTQADGIDNITPTLLQGKQ